MHPRPVWRALSTVRTSMRLRSREAKSLAPKSLAPKSCTRKNFCRSNFTGDSGVQFRTSSGNGRTTSWGLILHLFDSPGCPGPDRHCRARTLLPLGLSGTLLWLCLGVRFRQKSALCWNCWRWIHGQTTVELGPYLHKHNVKRVPSDTR